MGVVMMSRPSSPLTITASSGLLPALMASAISSRADSKAILRAAAREGNSVPSRSCSTFVLISANGFAQAETIGRYECSVVGTADQEPIGDKDGHRLASVQYSCFGVEGLVNGA